jgi:putative flippase GtrA
VFLLNKRWVWGQEGRPSMRYEVLPFWGFTLLGLLVSTVMVALASTISDSTVLLMVANIGGFGIVWLSKFLFLDSVVFAKAEARAAGSATAIVDL